MLHEESEEQVSYMIAAATKEAECMAALCSASLARARAYNAGSEQPNATIEELGALEDAVHGNNNNSSNNNNN